MLPDILYFNTCCDVIGHVPLLMLVTLSEDPLNLQVQLLPSKCQLFLSVDKRMGRLIASVLPLTTNSGMCMCANPIMLVCVELVTKQCRCNPHISYYMPWASHKVSHGITWLCRISGKCLDILIHNFMDITESVGLFTVVQDKLEEIERELLGNRTNLLKHILSLQ